MKMAKPTLTLPQYIFLIHGVQMGVGVLTLPRETAEAAGTDGWIGIVLSWVLATAASLIIIQVMKNYPKGTILDLLRHYFGKWIGIAGTILFSLYFGIMATVIFIREALFIQAWILPRTEVYILIALLSIPSYLIVRKNITILGRYSVLVFFMTVWMMIFFIIPLKQAQWLHLLPLLKEGWQPILDSVGTALFSFGGFEIAFFLYPFLQKKEKASMGIVIANTLTLFIYLIITIGAFVFFSPDEITIYNEPSIVMLKILEFRFIERLEIVFFAFYLFVISVTVLPLMYMTVYCTSQLAGEENHRRHLIWLLIIAFVYVVLVPPTFDQNKLLQRLIEQAGMVLAFAFPLCIWAYLLILRNIKRRGN
ncbi:spore gernimation protein [Mesobacillus campisalis]|uniref:Spore gernimation protein n=1 Tax=Mesobacillus campisalis TaxID=1408103 RepID=A0A0M2SUF7_9BACI|nr:endospore germination permease [Mesobacillus campisalis]KKK38219.1 spore gernimation protein [Mesobacillus campisalis]